MNKRQDGRPNPQELPVEPRHEERQAISVWEGQISSGEEGKKRTGRRERRILMGALAFFLCVALGLLGFSAAVAFRSSHEQAPLPDGDGQEETKKEKVVFVRDYDTESGVLSPSEVYAKCAETVVSVLTEEADGEGVGSGFLIREDGYIATAYHVLEDALAIRAVLSDGSVYEAKQVAKDELTDVALLKIEADGLPTVRFGESGELLVGESVFAIGTPASPEFAGSFCRGSVSYVRRTVRIFDESTGLLDKKMTMIQTDASVNPGNSGCPLFDAYGCVVGMVDLKLGQNYTGIAFALPSDGLRPMLEAMMTGQEVSGTLQSALGVRAPKLGLVGEADETDGLFGVRIVRFFDDWTSASSMLKEGDLILRIDETPVTSVGELRTAVGAKNPGDCVRVTVWRGGQRLTFEVTLE